MQGHSPEFEDLVSNNPAAAKPRICRCGHAYGEHAGLLASPGNACEIYGCMCAEFALAKEN